MKRILTFTLAMLMLLGLCACSKEEAPAKKPAEPKFEAAATDADIAVLDGLYAGRKAYFGDMHNHSDSYGRSDGHVKLADWPTEVMEPIQMDFAVLVDHKQSEHMRLPEWDDTLFVGGSEAGTTIEGPQYEQGNMHYNMIFTDPDKLDQYVKSHSEYNYRVDRESEFADRHPALKDGRTEWYCFSYPTFAPERFRERMAEIYALGGFYVQVHPLFNNYIKSEDPLGYWYADYSGFEVYTSGSKDYTPAHEAMIKAKATWVAMLDAGKIVFATSGSDDHRNSSAASLSALYSAEKHGDAYLQMMRKGDFTAGPVGIRMAMGDVCTGGQTDFEGKRLVISVADWHPQARQEESQYRLDIYNEKGLVGSIDLNGTDPVYFALDAEDCRYYRAEVWDVTNDYWFAVGNPIWNSKYVGK